MGKKLTIEEMQQIAKERGGECLSKKYINAHTKLKWQCNNGHSWDNTPFHIKQGQWCPYCYGRYQTLEDMQKIANERGGQCLSEKYFNSKTKLKWRCKKEHEWEATPEHIKEGTWCPICARNRKTVKG